MPTVWCFVNHTGGDNQRLSDGNRPAKIYVRASQNGFVAGVALNVCHHFIQERRNYTAVNYTGITLMLFERYEAGPQLFPIKLKIQMEADMIIRPTPVAVGVGDRGRVSVSFSCQFGCHCANWSGVLWSADGCEPVSPVRSRHKFFDCRTRARASGVQVRRFRLGRADFPAGQVLRLLIGKRVDRHTDRR